MNVWTLFINGELSGIFDSEEKVIEARRLHLAASLENPRLTVASVRRWALQ